MRTTWEALDEPVLRFVATVPCGATWHVDKAGVEPSDVPPLSAREMIDAMRRLHEAGLVAWSGRRETLGQVRWTRPRLSAAGLRLLGEWPVDSLDAAGLLSAVLRRLRDDPN